MSDRSNGLPSARNAKKLPQPFTAFNWLLDGLVDSGDIKANESDKPGGHLRR